ncbi:MAG: hypothetical protein P4L53_04565 [Candidatus Obscuribacterales bacterium]|nr:hypothetical protein [Candidatus Obscuribacterales bacterium]
MPNPLNTSKNPIIAFFALLIIGPFKLSDWLRKQAYPRYFSSYCFPYEAIALAFSIIAARSGTHGFNIWTFLISEAYGFPLLWLGFAKPLLKLWEKSGPRMQKFSTDYLARPLTGFADGLASVPGAGWLWTNAERSWFLGVVEVVTIASMVLGSLYTGWLAESWIAPRLWSIISAYSQNGIVHTVATFVFYGLGLSVAGFVGNLFVTMAIKTDDKGRGFIASAFLAVAAHSYIAIVAEPLKSAYWSYAATAAVALLLGTFVFPLVCYAASNGLIKKLYKAVKPVVDGFFSPPSSEEKVAKAYRDLFQQSTNLALTAYVGWHCFALLTGFGLNSFLVDGGTIFMTVFAFCLGGVVLNERWSNGLCDVIFAALIGYITFSQTEFLNSHLGHYAAIVAGVTAGVASFGLIVPLIYAGVKKVLSLPGLNVVTALGTGLRTAHTYINGHTFDPVYRASLIIYHECYRSDTPSERSYERVVLHLTNIVIALTLGVLAYLGLTTFVTSSLVLAVPLSLVASTLSYSLLGQLVMKGRAQLSGGLAGMFTAAGAAAYLTPNNVFGWEYSLPVAAVVGVLVFTFFYPLFYQAVQKTAGGLVCALEKPLDNRLNAAERVIAAPLLAGWHMLVSGWTALMSIFDGLFGHKSK